jgi:hypothetical protein
MLRSNLCSAHHDAPGPDADIVRAIARRTLRNGSRDLIERGSIGPNRLHNRLPHRQLARRGLHCVIAREHDLVNIRG